MKFTWKEDGRRIILIVVAAAISAVNIKSFVRTGGLYPGGVTGLTLLIQRACEMFFGWEIPYTLVFTSVTGTWGKNLPFIRVCRSW